MGQVDSCKNENDRSRETIACPGEIVLVTVGDEIRGKVVGQHIRVRGIVQGVGFRPSIWQLAKKFGVTGHVINDSSGVLVEAWATAEVLAQFVQAIGHNDLPLANIESIECVAVEPAGLIPGDFSIASSVSGNAKTGVSPDAATCSKCLADTVDPLSRRFRYPFTNCTHCGPRLSIIKAIPYDRSNTSMSAFALCKECRIEYEDPANRRFHAQPNACSNCGPTVHLERSDQRPFSIDSLTTLDDVDATISLIKGGEIIAIKGLGGFHLACDATNDQAVARLRKRKHRYAKPLALMARDLEVVRRYCHLSEPESALLTGSSAPIVILDRLAHDRVSPLIAPGQSTLGFILPYTPLHHLLMEPMDTPIVLTSGNLSDEPQCIDNADACVRLSEIADYILLHNRDIINRVDDSVVRVVAGAPRVIRRGRGYAPAPMVLPPGFQSADDLLAMGGELKNTLCLIKDGAAVITQHIGDLKEARAYADYQKNLALFENLYQLSPQHIAVDWHPEYLSTKLGRSLAAERNITVHKVQHHHAHIAACLAENQWPLDAGPVLGIALDGLGLGSDGELWGGELIQADYYRFERLGTFKPVALLGGSQAMREPWRNTYAHIMAELGWKLFKENFAELELASFLESKPLQTFERMLISRTNAPQASSCGRLFDAFAAAVGVCRDTVSYEGQAAIELEAIVDMHELNRDDTLAYPFTLKQLSDKKLPYIEPLSMWQAALADMILHTPTGVMAARFHKGLARALVEMVNKLSTQDAVRRFDTVALSGGVFQNKVLLEQVVSRLERAQFQVLTHRQVPANDAGIALGQAVITAARVISGERN